MTMTLAPHAVLAIFLTIAALVVISRDRIPLEYSAAGVLVVLVLVFEIFPVPGDEPLRGARFLEGFGNEALLTICLLLVLARGVEFSGALRPVGRALTRLWLGNRSVALLATLVIAGSISAFANNTPIVVMLLPILIGVAHRTNTTPSRILMPIGFATIIGGMCTTIGTSTNLLVVSVSEDLGLPRLQMFDFFLPAAFAALVGILYLWVVAPRILPDRPFHLEGVEQRIYDTIITVEDGTAIAGKTLAELRSIVGEQIRVTRVVRGDALELVRLPTLQLLPGDQLHLRGTPEAIRQAQESTGISAESDLRSVSEERLVEIVVTRESPLHHKRVSELQASTLRGLTPVGWYRAGRAGLTRLGGNGEPILRAGDVLLMQGNWSAIQQLIDTSHVLVLARSIHVPRTAKAPLAVAIMAGVVLTAALGILPIVASALLGVAAILLSRCLTWNEAWKAVDTRLALVIVVSLALGMSLVETGAAAYIAHLFVGLVEGLPPWLILSGLILLTALLTEVITNNAVAVIATPIAMQVAAELGLPPLPFVLAVLFGANMSYLTPIGYQTNLLVMSAGGYRFADFFRAGMPLQILLWLALSAILPFLYL